MNRKFLSCMLLMASVLTLQAQRVSKKISLNKGQKLESVVSSTMSMSQEMAGQQMDVKSNSTATSLFEVKDVTDKSFVLSNTLKRIVVNSSMMGQEMNFDSDKKEDMEGQIGAAFKNKIGVSQDMVIDKKGKITEMKDTATGADMVSSITGGNLMVGVQFPVLTVLPDKPVKSGDTWVDSTGTPQTVKLVNTYTLEKVSGNDAFINFTGTMAKAGIIEQQGMQVTMNLNGTSKGVSVYDINTGILKNNNTETKITGTMEVMGQSIPITATTTATTTVSKQ